VTMSVMHRAVYQLAAEPVADREPPKWRNGHVLKLRLPSLRLACGEARRNRLSPSCVMRGRNRFLFNVLQTVA
jgi:hypothetical protein